MSLEKVCAQNLNVTRIKALSHLVTEMRPKIEILSLTLHFPLKGEGFDEMSYPKILDYMPLDE